MFLEGFKEYISLVKSFFVKIALLSYIYEKYLCNIFLKEEDSSLQLCHELDRKFYYRNKYTCTLASSK